MAQVTFVSDMEEDMKNIWDKCNKKPNFGNFKISQKLKKICIGKTFKQSKPELEKFLKGIYDSNYIKIFIKTMQELWSEIEEEFFNRMSDLMKNKYNKKIKAYITTIGICPYNPQEPSFMVSLIYPFQIAVSTCGHEIMHLYFHDFYWSSVETKIGTKKTGDLKEALTVLLNLEFKDLRLTEDRGYKEHKKLREFILKKWKEEKNIEILLDKCVVYLSK
jgi:hypothetical protein